MDALAVGDDLMTTGEVARLLGSSRQHVVDLCDRGVLPHESVGTHRRVRRQDVMALQHGDGGMGRDQLRSLWLHRAVAGKVVAEPERALRIARRNLARLKRTHRRGQAVRQLKEWEQLIDGPIELLLDALTSRSQRGIELRQNSPFAGLLTERERARVLHAFAAHAATR